MFQGRIVGEVDGDAADSLLKTFAPRVASPRLFINSARGGNASPLREGRLKYWLAIARTAEAMVEALIKGKEKENEIYERAKATCSRSR